MSPFRLFLVCAALTYLTACTNCTDTIDDAKVKTAWQQYDEASRANNLDQTLAIIDNLESLKGIITPRANYLRAIAYDRLGSCNWQSITSRVPTKALISRPNS